MNAIEALNICRDIKRIDKTESEKAIAIYRILQMPTLNSIRKDDLLNIVDWLWHQHYEVQ